MIMNFEPQLSFERKIQAIRNQLISPCNFFEMTENVDIIKFK